MSQWGNQVLTLKGRELMAKVHAEQHEKCRLELTRMELGSGKPTNIEAMTSLVHKEMDIGLSSCIQSSTDNGVCTVTANASSTRVVNSFPVTELGLYAIDPYTQKEILYLVVVDENPDVMPNNTAPSPVSVIYQIDITVGNAQAVTAKIDPAGLVTVEMLAKAEGWSMWEIDLEGGVMPVTHPLYHPYWETDDNGDIMPRNAN